MYICKHMCIYIYIYTARFILSFSDLFFPLFKCTLHQGSTDSREEREREKKREKKREKISLKKNKEGK